MNQIISIANLSFNYGPVEVLQNVTFSLNKGDYVALAGPNGAGKTTLIRNILGLTDNFGGRVELFGQNLSDFKNWDRIGYLPQRVNLFNPLFPATVKEVIGLGLLSGKRFPKKFKGKDDESINRTLDLMGIVELRDKLVGELSGGQQQRVFLARALVSNPDLLILDEPGTALDPQSRGSFFELMRKLNQEQGLAIILITHDTGQIGQFANKLLYLDKKIIFFGSFADFCSSQEMSTYFGSFIQHFICHQHN
jgi:zinc transport system ATP-binding protein